MLQVRGESCGKMDAFNDDSSSASSSGGDGGGGSSAGAAGQFTAVQATQAVDMIEIPFQPAEGTTAAIVAGGWAFNRCQDNPTYSSTLKFHMKALLGDLRMSFSKALVSKTSNIQAVEEFVAPESAVLEGCAWCCWALDCLRGILDCIQDCIPCIQDCIPCSQGYSPGIQECLLGAQDCHVGFRIDASSDVDVVNVVKCVGINTAARHACEWSKHTNSLRLAAILLGKLQRVFQQA